MEPISLLSALPALGGFAAGIIQKFVAIKEKRVDHELQMARLSAETERERTLADLKLRQTAEEQAGASFTKAIEAQSSYGELSLWVRNSLGLFRPGLTLLLFLITFILFFFVDADTQSFLAVSYLNLGQTAGGYWFGQRTFEKLTSVRVRGARTTLQSDQ